MKKFFVLSLAFFVVGCATMMDMTPQAETAEETAYLKEAMSAPLTFVVPKDKSDETWGRVNSFIAKYSSMKIQTASDYIIQTYNPTDTIHFGYQANRAPRGDEVEFTVTCYSGGLFGGSKNIPDQNSHLLAYYALTGKIVPRLIVQ